MVQDLIVESEVIAGDDVDASIPLQFPVLESKSLALLQQLFLRSLARPVVLGNFLEIAVGSHARETED